MSYTGHPLRVSPLGAFNYVPGANQKTGTMTQVISTSRQPATAAVHSGSLMSTAIPLKSNVYSKMQSTHQLYPFVDQAARVNSTYVRPNPQYQSMYPSIPLHTNIQAPVYQHVMDPNVSNVYAYRCNPITPNVTHYAPPVPTVQQSNMKISPLQHEMLNQPVSGLNSYSYQAQYPIMQEPIMHTRPVTLNMNQEVPQYQCQQTVAPTFARSPQTHVTANYPLKPLIKIQEDYTTPYPTHSAVTAATAAAIQESTTPAPVARPAHRSGPVQVGDIMPPAHIDLHGVCVNLQEFFENRTGVLFGVLGAYNPHDTKVTVPSILENMTAFERLVDFVGCLSVNDPFVIKAWAKKLGVSDQFTFIADSNAALTEALGLTVDLPDEGLGIRCRRFVAIVGTKSRFRWIALDEEATAENVLAALPSYVRTPWKSFLVGIGYDESIETSGSTTEELSSVARSLDTMRQYLSAYGFCPESDWQLVLSDRLQDVFRPTAENIISGLRWLVDGAQAGDVLCFYFLGKTKKNNNSVQLVTVDQGDGGTVSLEELTEILIPNVPRNCRLNIIFDVQGETPVIPKLPFGLFEAEDKTQQIEGEILVVTTRMRHEKHCVPQGVLASLLGRQSKGATYAQTASSLSELLQKHNPNEEVAAQLVIKSSRPIPPNDDFNISDVLDASN